jgi:catechol 2,3-dioxygenase-like lactoylglutathione lyase family enzyme
MTTFRMTMLVCADLARSRDFYRDKIGLTVGTDYPPHWVDFDLGGGAQLGLHPADARLTVAPGSMSIGFTVGDVDTLIANLKADGVTIVTEPFDENFGRLAVVADPDGYSVQLLTPKA